MLVPWLLSCASVPDGGAESRVVLEESDVPPRLRGAWELGGGVRLELEDGWLWFRDGPDRWIAADRVIGAPAVSGAGDRIAYCRQGDGIELASIEVWELENGERRGPVFLTDGDRPALSPDGEWVAFVSGRTGIASLWIAPFAGGEAIQLTNRDLERRRIPGEVPRGFVPPPHLSAPQFDGDRLVWRSPAGEHAVELP